MVTFLTVISLLIGFTGLYAYQWITFLPRAPISFQYYMGRRHAVMALLILLPASMAFALSPTAVQGGWLALAALFALNHGLLRPTRALPVVDDPRPVSAAQAPLGDKAWVMGVALEDALTGITKARAWSLETLVPHHLINDRLHGIPLLVAW